MTCRCLCSCLHVADRVQPKSFKLLYASACQGHWPTLWHSCTHETAQQPLSLCMATSESLMSWQVIACTDGLYNASPWAASARHSCLSPETVNLSYSCGTAPDDDKAEVAISCLRVYKVFFSSCVAWWCCVARSARQYNWRSCVFSLQQCRAHWTQIQAVRPCTRQHPADAQQWPTVQPAQM